MTGIYNEYIIPSTMFSGHPLYTWKYAWGLRVGLTLIVLLMVPGLVSAFLEKNSSMLVMFLTFVLPLTAFAVRSWTRKFQIFPEGVSCRGWFFSRSLRYDQVGSMVFWTSREVDWNVGDQYSGPTDAGNRIHLLLKPAKEFRRRAIRFDMWRMSTVPPAFETLCEQAASAVAQRIKQRIAAGERIKWGRYAAFTSQGLLIRPRRFIFFRGAEQLIQNGPFFRGVQEGNAFRVYETGCSRPVLSISCRVPNFHAGQIVFSSLCYPATDTERKSP